MTSIFRWAVSYTATLLLCLSALSMSSPAQAGDTVVYYLTDTLHSTVVVTDAQRNVIERTHYAPYGAVLNRPMRDGPGYAGHEEDAATGLVYMQQRYYDPQTGQFLSPDPVQPDTTVGGNFNRYWYANDNPYRYTDPDGRQQYDDNAAELENRWSDPSVAAGEVQAGQTALGASADALGWVDTNILTPLGPDGGAELHVAVAPLIGVMREAAAAAKTAEAAKAVEGGAKEAVSMSKAVDKAIAHAGSDAEVGMTKGGNVQFSKSVTDQSGNTVTKNARFDVNPANSHVQKQGPHLNIETQQNGKVIQNDHIPIDPKTIRPGDHG